MINARLSHDAKQHVNKSRHERADRTLDRLKWRLMHEYNAQEVATNLFV